MSGIAPRLLKDIFEGPLRTLIKGPPPVHVVPYGELTSEPKSHAERMPSLPIHLKGAYLLLGPFRKREQDACAWCLIQHLAQADENREGLRRTTQIPVTGARLPKDIPIPRQPGDAVIVDLQQRDAPALVSCSPYPMCSHLQSTEHVRSVATRKGINNDWEQLIDGTVGVVRAVHDWHEIKPTSFVIDAPVSICVAWYVNPVFHYIRARHPLGSAAGTGIIREHARVRACFEAIERMVALTPASSEQRGTICGTDIHGKSRNVVADQAFIYPSGKSQTALTTSGCAAHRVKSSAALHAVEELLERDALLRNWYGGRPGIRIKFDACASDPLILHFERHGFQVTLVEASSGPPVVVLALVRNCRNRWPAFLATAAADTDPKTAIARALREAFQVLAIALHTHAHRSSSHLKAQDVKTPSQHYEYFFDPAHLDVVTRHHWYDKSIDHARWMRERKQNISMGGTSRLASICRRAAIDPTLVQIAPTWLQERGVYVVRAICSTLAPLRFGLQAASAVAEVGIAVKPTYQDVPHPFG